MKKLLLLTFVILICCTSLVAAKDKGEVKVSGKLYWINNDGKEMPPTPLGWVGVVYWKGTKVADSIKVVKNAEGKMIVVHPIGTGKVNKDGYFSFNIDINEIPEEQKIISLIHVTVDGQMGNFIKKDTGEIVKLEIKDASKIVVFDLGKIKIIQR
jgi:hypothetical protein